jgi:voltage-gated potassium channel
MQHPLWHRVVAAIYRHVAVVTWPALLFFVAVHLSVSWLAFLAAGEDKAADLDTFWYYYVVTATTIGYGDVAPTSLAGRAVAVLWIIPGGIALFTAVITKLVQSVAKIWNSRMRGEGDYSDMEGHTVIVGWSRERTPRLVNLLNADRRYGHAGIVLVASGVEHNPLPDVVRFVRVDQLPSDEGLGRSGAARAASVIVLGGSDHESLAVALSVGALDPPPRIVAHFDSQRVADLLTAHCETAECAVSMSLEILARSAQDPGSSEVHRQIVSPVDSPTQYRLVVPDGVAGVDYGRAFAFFKSRYDATVLALQRPGRTVEVNASSATPLAPGDSLFFLAAHRLLPHEIDWPACAAAGTGG